MPAQRDVKQKNGGARWLDMLLFPPTILATVLLAGLLLRGRGASGAELSAPSAAASLFAYVALSAAYLTLTKLGQRLAAIAAALIADGVLMVFMSAELGAADGVGWLGALLVLAGAGIALSRLAPRPAKQFAAACPDLFPENVGRDMIKRIVSTIACPAAFLQIDEGGEDRIVAGNEPFAAILGRTAPALDGQRFADLISPDIEQKTLTFAGAEWVSHRTAKGSQTMFMLSPAVRTPEPEEHPSANAIIDPELGIFTQYYMNYKGESDVQLCRRYRHSLSALLFTMEFNKNSIIQPDEEMKRAAFSAFAHVAAVTVRACDTAFHAGDFEIGVILPDTPQQGARTVADRMLQNAKKAARVEVPEIAQTNISVASVTFFGDELTSYDGLLNELYVAKGRAGK